MADEKKTKTGLAAPVDLAALAPEGYEVAEAYQTGLLTPLYLPKFAARKTQEGQPREGFPDIAGWFDRIHIMPEQKRTAGTSKRRAEEEDAWVPFNLLVRDLKIPTKGVRRNEMGELTEKSIVAVPAGEKVLVPITGQITVNQDIQDALLDLDHVYYLVVRCGGFRKVNNLNAMADWEIYFLRDAKKNKLKKKRDGEFILPDWYKHAVMSGDIVASIQTGELVGALGEGGRTPDGSRFDTKSGEVLPAGVAAPSMS